MYTVTPAWLSCIWICIRVFVYLPCLVKTKVRFLSCHHFVTRLLCVIFYCWHLLTLMYLEWMLNPQYVFLLMIAINKVTRLYLEVYCISINAFTKCSINFVKVRERKDMQTTYIAITYLNSLLDRELMKATCICTQLKSWVSCTFVTLSPPYKTKFMKVNF